MRLVGHLHRTGGRTARSAVVVLGGAGVLLAGALAVPAAASGAGAAGAAGAAGGAPVGTRAAAATSTSTTAPRTSTSTSGGKVTCSWAPSYVSSVMPTAIAFHLQDTSMCITPGPSSSTITVYANQVDAQAHTDPVGSATAMWGLDGVVAGLQPDTDYWWVGTDQGGWVRGPVHTLTALVTTSTSTTGPTCNPDLTRIEAVTATSISFRRPSSADCPLTGQLTVDVYARRADAEARRRVVGTVTGPAGSLLVVGGLKPNRAYWYVSSDAHYARGPVKTLKAKTTSTTSAPPSCTAGYRVVNAWSGGFVAEVAVTATTPINAWRLTMITTTGDTIEQAWGAVVTPSSVFWTSTGSNTKPPSGLLAYSAVNLPGAGVLAASETYRWGILGSITPGVSPSTMSVTCIAS